MVPESSEPLAYIAVDRGQGEELVPVFNRLFVGRECLGIDDSMRLIIDDPVVSRHHLEIRLDPERDHAEVVDLSTNGTRLNGVRIGRSDPCPLRAGDRLTVGPLDLEFRSNHFRGTLEQTAATTGRSTLKNVTICRLAMVAGDIIGYSTISQYTDSGVLLNSIDRLYGELHSVLSAHRGTLNNYVGDAFFAIWECDADPDSSRNALAFAMAAVDRTHEIAPELPLRDAGGHPIGMGWGVVTGQAAVSSLTGMLVTVLGDATNLAFRLSGLAGRSGRSPVLVTEAVRDAVSGAFEFDAGTDVEVKGRTGIETVYGVRRR